MADVRMTLKEYDEIKQEMDMLKSIVMAFTTPRVIDYDIENFNDATDPRSLYLYSRYLSYEQDEYMKGLLKDNLKKFIGEHINYGPGVDFVDYGDMSIGLGRLEKKYPEEEEVQ